MAARPGAPPRGSGPPRWQRQGQAAAPCSKVQRIHRLGGGRVSPEVLPPPGKFPPLPCQSLQPRRKSCQVQEPRRGCVGAHSPTAPAAPSRVPRPHAVIPPGLPQPPARSVGAGVSAALQGGREGGAERRALQGHLLEELVELRAGRQVHAGRHPGGEREQRDPGQPPQAPPQPPGAYHLGELCSGASIGVNGASSGISSSRGSGEGPPGSSWEASPGMYWLVIKLLGGKRGKGGRWRGHLPPLGCLAAPGRRREALGLEAGAHLLVGSTSWAGHWEHWSAGDGPPHPPCACPGTRGRGGRAGCPPPATLLHRVPEGKVLAAGRQRRVHDHGR